MAVDFEFKSKYNVDDLLSIMRILRERAAVLGIWSRLMSR